MTGPRVRSMFSLRRIVIVVLLVGTVMPANAAPAGRFTSESTSFSCAPSPDVKILAKSCAADAFAGFDGHLKVSGSIESRFINSPELLVASAYAQSHIYYRLDAAATKVTVTVAFHVVHVAATATRSSRSDSRASSGFHVSAFISDCSCGGESQGIGLCAAGESSPDPIADRDITEAFDVVDYETGAIAPGTLDIGFFAQAWGEIGNLHNPLIQRSASADLDLTVTGVSVSVTPA